MERLGITGDERTGLIVALALHLALLAVMVTQALLPAPEFPKTERMVVSLAEEIGLEATAPVPVEDSRAAIAPELAERPEPSAERSEPETRPATDRTSPPTITNNPRRDQQREQPRDAEQPKGSRIGDNFLAGAGSSSNTNETRAPAEQIGASTKASLFQAIQREIRQQRPPLEGPDLELLVTKIRFRLNPDGSLNGRPVVLGQTGENDTNRSLKGRHAELAVRAIQLAAPFELPEKYYEAWKTVTVDIDWTRN